MSRFTPEHDAPEGDPPRPRYALRHRILLAACAAVVSLVALELLCRAMAGPPQSLRFQQDVGELNSLGLNRLAGVIQNDEELFWRFVPNQQLPPGGGPFFGVISNSQGLREDHEIAVPKPAGERRVLFLGDSCTFGYGLDLREGFVQQCEELLKRELGDPAQIECINAGVPGYSLFQGWRFLETEGFRYEPDVVVVCFGWNDLSMWDNRSDLEHYDARRSTQPPGVLRFSRLCQRVWPLFTTPAARSQQQRPRLLPEEFRSLLEQVHRAARQHSARLLLLVWGFRYQVEQAAALSTPLQSEQYLYSVSHDVPMIDLVPVFEQLSVRHSPQGVFLDDGHATALANQEVARLLVEKLRPWLQEQTTTNHAATEP